MLLLRLVKWISAVAKMTKSRVLTLELYDFLLWPYLNPNRVNAFKLWVSPWVPWT